MEPGLGSEARRRGRFWASFQLLAQSSMLGPTAHACSSQRGLSQLTNQHSGPGSAPAAPLPPPLPFRACTVGISPHVRHG